MKKITIPDSGKRSWSDGARCLAFVYSNRGNFQVEGYYAEINNYLKDLSGRGYRYFVNITLWGNRQHRNIWKFWKEDYYISEPTITRNGKWSKWEVVKYFTNGERKLTFKRLPKRWIPEFDEL